MINTNTNTNTKAELEKLNATLQMNPKLIKPKDIENDTDDDSCYSNNSINSDDSNNDCCHISSNSSSSSSNNNKYRIKKRKNHKKTTITVDELKINRLEKEKHYQTLELSNIGVELEQLKQEHEICKNIIKYIRLIITFLDYTFAMNDIEAVDMNDLKYKILKKAKKFNLIENTYNEIMSNDFNNIPIDFRMFFDKAVVMHFDKIKKDFDCETGDFIIKKNKTNTGCIKIICGLVLCIISYISYIIHIYSFADIQDFFYN